MIKNFMIEGELSLDGVTVMKECDLCGKKVGVSREIFDFSVKSWKYKEGEIKDCYRETEFENGVFISKESNIYCTRGHWADYCD